MNRNLWQERRDLYKILQEKGLDDIVNKLMELDNISGNKQEVNRLWDNVRDKSNEIQSEIYDFIRQKFDELDTFISSHNDSFFIDEHICVTCGQKVSSDL